MDALERTRNFTQFQKPYHSTVAMSDFLQRHNCLPDGAVVLDVGTGLGAAMLYLGSQNPNAQFVGVDYNAEFISEAREQQRIAGLDNVSFDTADLRTYSYGGDAPLTGVISIHTLCCFKHLDEGIAPLMTLNPEWIFINSLFCDGPMDVLIHIREHIENPIPDDDPDGDFNIFSLQGVEAFAADRGYTMTAEPFYAPAPIPAPEDGSRGSYTMRTEIHDQTWFSGPVHLPWHFVLLQRR